MTKQQAKHLFGGVANLARALQCTPQAYYNWPDPLPLAVADRIAGACLRLGTGIHLKPYALG